LEDKTVAKAAAPALRKLAASEKNTMVLAQALNSLAQLKDKKDEKLFNQHLNSQSYAVQAAALRGLAAVQPTQALARAKALEKDDNGAIAQAVTQAYAQGGGVAEWAYIRDKFDAGRPQTQFGMMESIGTMAGRLNDATAITEGVSRLKTLGMKYKMYGADKPVIEQLKAIADKQANGPNAALAREQTGKAIAEIEAAK
jgi:aminopeptidase N